MSPPQATGHGALPAHRDAHSHGSCTGPSELHSRSGAQRHRHVRPDRDWRILRNSDASTPLPQHRFSTSCPSRQPREGRQERAGERLDADAAHRGRPLGLIKYILRYISQFLTLRLLAAEATRVLLLPALDAASAPLTASSEIMSRASEAHSQVDSRAGEHRTLSAHTAHTHHRQPHATRRQRSSRGSGASRRGQPSC